MIALLSRGTTKLPGDDTSGVVGLSRSGLGFGIRSIARTCSLHTPYFPAVLLSPGVVRRCLDAQGSTLPGAKRPGTGRW